MEFYYKIANQKFRLKSDTPLIENLDSSLFRDEISEEPDINCEVKFVEELPDVQGSRLGQALDTRLYQTKEGMYLETFHKEDKQGMILSYLPKSTQEMVQIWALKKHMPHTARLQVLWSAMDLPYQLLKKNVLTLHSSVVEINGGVIIFFAPSGVGKSTQAALWERYRGAKQLNGDKTGISSENNRTIAYGLPFCGTSKICTNFSLPVRGMVLLSQAEENKISRLTGLTALKAVMDNCFGHPSMEGCMEQMIEITSKILENVPIYALACTPDENAVICLEEQLRKDNRYDNFVQSVD